MGPDPGYDDETLRLLAATGFAARISRRQLMQRGAVAFGGIAGLGLIDPSVAFGSTFVPPAPIPGGLDANFAPVPEDPFIHVLAPSVPSEMASITDFNGVIGASETQGSALGSDGSSYDFDCDMRFMRGVYVGIDGRKHNASFGFI